MEKLFWKMLELFAVVQGHGKDGKMVWEGELVMSGGEGSENVRSMMSENPRSKRII